MRNAVDTTIISAIWSNEPLASNMAALLGQARAEGGLVVCAPVYMELLAHPKVTVKFVEDFLGKTDIRVDFALDEIVWREAGTCFATYAQRRRRSGGGQIKRLLADFLIGAHALIRTDRLLTLDPGRYRQAFPKLRLFS